MTITLFDNQINYLEQGTESYISSRYGIDKRNLAKGAKKVHSDYIAPAERIITLGAQQETISNKNILKDNNIKLYKISNYYYTALDIEIRDIAEKEMPFMDDTSNHDILIYTVITQQKVHSDYIGAKAPSNFVSEFKNYIDKYKNMTANIVSDEAYYNYYINPRINITKARASYAAAYKTIHNKSLPWFPVNRDAIDVFADDFEN